MSKYFINDSTMTGIADATRRMCGTKNQMTPEQIKKKILDSTIKYGVNISNHIVDGHWVRPQEYPNLDSLTIPSDFDGMYLTYDLRKTPGYGWIGLYIQLEGNSAKYYVERGHIEDGTFIVDEYHEQNRNTYFRQTLDDTNGDIQLWRVRSDGHILRKGFCSSTTSSSTAIINQLQPCVECVGVLNYLNNLAGTAKSTSLIAQNTMWMEHEKISCAGFKNVTQLLSTWDGCYSLQSLEVNNWNTSGWSLTTLQNTWRDCYSLVSLDLSNWDVSNWRFSSLASIFQNCYSLESLNISTWDVSKWGITSLNSMFYNCNSLIDFDISNWDVSGWKLDTFARNFYGCYSIRYLDFSKWDVSKWQLTSFTYNFYQCCSLYYLDMSTWDTTNWAVQSMNCNWTGCQSLIELDLLNWNTSNWCITTFTYVFSSCYSLKELDLSNWDTSNWEVSSIIGAFSGLSSLNVLDLSSWDISKWQLNNISAFIDGCTNLTTLKLPDGAFSGLNNNTYCPNSFALQDYSGEEIYTSHSYESCYMLTPQSIINILNKLPTVSTTTTITLGQVNRLKVTSVDIAVATQKGWTVA